MSRKTSSKAAEAEEVEVIPEEVKVEPVEKVEAPKPRKAKAAKKEEPVAYIGPDIKNIAKGGTIYTNGLPEALNKKIEDVPSIKGLIVPVSKLSTAIKAVETDGTSLNNLYKVVAEKI